MRYIGLRMQRGAATAIVVLFLLVTIAAALLAALNMAGSDAYDSASQHSSIEALFLAESGLERASQRYASGTACNASLLDLAPIPFAGGTFQVIAPTPAVVAGLCLVRVRGVFGGASRIVDVGLRSSGVIAFDAATPATPAITSTLTWNHTVTAAGADRIVLVGVSLRSDAGQTVTAVTYAGAALTPMAAVNANQAYAQIWYRLNPATGSNPVVVTLSASARVMAGAVSFTGVSQANPIDASISGSGNTSSPATVTLTTVADNAWILDTLAIRGGAAITGPGAGQTQRWNAATGGGGGELRGAGSTRGPITPPAAVNVNWGFTGTRRWSLTAVALRPAVSVAQWREVVN